MIALSRCGEKHLFGTSLDNEPAFVVLCLPNTGSEGVGMAAIVHIEHRPVEHLRPVAATAPPPPARAGRAHDGLVLGLLALILLAAVAVRFGASSGTVSDDGAVRPGRATVHVVERGDTYWSIAAGRHAGGDVRAAVDHLVEANGRRTLQPGDRLVLALSDDDPGVP